MSGAEAAGRPASPSMQGREFVLFDCDGRLERWTSDMVLKDLSGLQHQDYVGGDNEPSEERSEEAEALAGESDPEILISADEIITRYIRDYPHTWVARMTRIRQAVYPSQSLTEEQRMEIEKGLLADHRVGQTAMKTVVVLGEPGPLRDEAIKLLDSVHQVLLELARSHPPGRPFAKKVLYDRLSRRQESAGRSQVDAMGLATIKQFLFAHPAVRVQGDSFNFEHLGYSESKSWLERARRALNGLQQAKVGVYEHSSLLKAMKLKHHERANLVFIESLLGEYGFYRMGETDLFVGSAIHDHDEYTSLREKVEQFQANISELVEELADDGYSSISMQQCLARARTRGIQGVDGELGQLFLKLLTAHPLIEAGPDGSYLKITKQTNQLQGIGKVVQDPSKLRRQEMRSSTVNFSSARGGKNHGKKES